MNDIYPNHRTNTIKSLFSKNPQLAFYMEGAIVWALFLVGLWLVVIRNLGYDLSMIPGGLGDARFNNYILEHVFRRLIGLDDSFRNAPFFFPFPQTVAFSDSLLGSAPFYIAFRYFDLDRETAFQAWYMFGFLLNYFAAGIVLSKSGFKPIAVAAGALFFSFGLPVLGQITHAQLLYRFAIPFACYMLWRFFEKSKLFYLVALLFWFVWQFYLSLYLGVFLAFCLLLMAILLPIFHSQSIRQCFYCWPIKLKTVWVHSHWNERILSLIFIVILSFALIKLMHPYFNVTKVYGFARSWDNITEMLPRWQSYLLADNSPLWKFSSQFATDLPYRHEHQLFPGLAALIIISIGVFRRPVSETGKIAWLNLIAAIGLVVFTLYFHGFTLYKLIWWIPGINSIRAVSRIMLVIMWPLAFFISYVTDSLFQSQNRYLAICRGAAIILTFAILLESAIFVPYTSSKASAQERLVSLRKQIPDRLPDNPVLFVATSQDGRWIDTEIDAMLLSQELGWPTMNGYSGNFPPGFTSGNDCSLISKRIRDYMKFAKINDENFFNDMVSRIVPVGFNNCNTTQ